MIDTVIKPIHREGWRFVAYFAVGTVLAWIVWMPLGLVGVVLTIWCYYFFRDPVRQVPQRAGLLVSPADGVVSHVVSVVPPPELGLGEAEMTRISVFMNVFNVHVNRAPIAGRLERIAYTPGRFFNASLDKASEHNERNGLVLRLADGQAIGVVQIAGLVARRILCEVREGQDLATGERFGLIRFGSRVDIFLPAGVAPQVGVGQTMIAGETVIADLGAVPPPDGFRAD